MIIDGTMETGGGYDPRRHQAFNPHHGPAPGDRTICN